MVPRVLIASAEVPGGGEALRLIRRGDEFSIMLGSNELMNSRLSGSEAALANLACEAIEDRASPHVLIGGLGMGFTLRAALAVLEKDATVSVAELVPAVVDWARGPLAHIHGDSLADPRVQIAIADVGDLIRAGRASYDAILLDVDNGPDGLSRAQNDSLYDVAGLSAARASLRPGGVLAIWSSASDRAFTQRLRRLGFAVEETAVRARRQWRGAPCHLAGNRAAAMTGALSLRASRRVRA
ncbi:spermidine synthase [Falsiroseomonas sp.]|uniref:spermidine synthase n=1 Tax=Falsiroseomonas sp. TaxID=2870721 RepID=UPI002716B5AF|nr:MnmC family methyltransferase [Falsiroseomonas sp.]MDO9498496.1 MnmC family methyltransferase [Falsiroseomonas sp.]